MIRSIIARMFCSHELVKKRMPIEGSLDTYHVYVECIKCPYRSEGVTIGGGRYITRNGSSWLVRPDVDVVAA